MTHLGPRHESMVSREKGEGSCFPAHKQLQVQKMCTRKGRSGRAPLFKRPFKFSKSLCSSLCGPRAPSHAPTHIPFLNVASRRTHRVCCEVFRNYIIGEACEFALRWMENASLRITVTQLDGFLEEPSDFPLGPTLLGCPARPSSSPVNHSPRTLRTARRPKVIYGVCLCCGCTPHTHTVPM